MNLEQTLSLVSALCEYDAVSEFLRYCPAFDPALLFKSPDEALNSFAWANTIQGADFWAMIVGRTQVYEDPKNTFEYRIIGEKAFQMIPKEYLWNASGNEINRVKFMFRSISGDLQIFHICGRWYFRGLPNNGAIVNRLAPRTFYANTFAKDSSARKETWASDNDYASPEFVSLQSIIRYLAILYNQDTMAMRRGEVSEASEPGLKSITMEEMRFSPSKLVTLGQIISTVDDHQVHIAEIERWGAAPESYGEPKEEDNKEFVPKVAKKKVQHIIL